MSEVKQNRGRPRLTVPQMEVGECVIVKAMRSQTIKENIKEDWPSFVFTVTSDGYGTVKVTRIE